MSHRVPPRPLRWTILAALALASLAPRPAAGAAEWPQFHGPPRDNISDERGLLKQWPPDGPKRLWTAQGIGHGFSTVAIAGGLIYTAGNVGADTVITALDPDGKTRWTARNGPACKHDRPGTRSTPTVDGSRLYHENANGDLACLDARTGKLLWSVNILKKFRGGIPRGGWQNLHSSTATTSSAAPAGQTPAWWPSTR